jgi:glycogen(starch) synthase
MRILMVSEDLPSLGMGGLARHVLSLSRALMSAGHQVDLMGSDDVPIAAAGADFTFEGRFFPELRGQFDGWKEMTLGVFVPAKRSVIARRFARAVMRRARHYDAIHYHGHLPNIARFIPPGVNFIQTRHDQGSDCLIHTRFKRGRICRSTDERHCADCRTWQPNILQRAVSSIAVKRFRHEVIKGFRRHKTVFVSDLLQQNLSRSFGAGHWGVTVHNFVDSEQLKATRAQAVIPANDGLLRVFIAAKLYPAKGVESFLDALSKRQDHASNIDIDIVGDGSDEQRLRDHFPFARFHGWQDWQSSLKLAARAHAIVVPSVCEEACPSTVLEGLLLGKTVFALKLGGTPELAAYQSGPSQLRLHDTLRELVDALLLFRPRPDYPLSPRTPTGAAEAAGRLLALYRLPPGPLATGSITS